MKRIKYLLLLLFISFLLPINIYAETDIDEYIIKTTFDADFNNIEKAPVYLTLRDKLIISTLDNYDPNSLENEVVYNVNLLKLESINKKFGFDILNGRRRVKIIKYDVINSKDNILKVDVSDVNLFLDSTYMSFDIIDNLVSNNKLIVNNLSNSNFEFINSDNKKLFVMNNFRLESDEIFRINTYEGLDSSDNIIYDMNIGGFNKIKINVSGVNKNEEIDVIISNPKTNRNILIYGISIGLILFGVLFLLKGKEY